MATIVSFLPEVQGLPLAEFLRRYQHPFLLVSEEQAIDLKTGGQYFTTASRTDSSQPPKAVPSSRRVEKNVFELKKDEAQCLFSFISVGRSSNNDIVISGSGVSKLHAIIQQTPEGYVVLDSNSRNGTFLNGARLPPQKPIQLADKDLLHFAGTVSARFLLPGSLFVWLREGHAWPA